MAWLTRATNRQHKPIQAKVESTSLLSGNVCICECKHRSRASPSVLALCMIFVVTFWTFVFISWHMRFDQNSSDMAGTRSFFASVDRSYRAQHFSHFNYSSSAYTGAPTPEIDAAWASIGTNYWPFFVSMSQGYELGFERKRHSWIGKELLTVDADGQDVQEDQYLAGIETVHWLHCLNTIRKSLYYTRDYYAAREPKLHDKEKDQHLDRAHIDHCIDALRERLMCTADMEPLPWLWVGKGGFRLPDFTRPHKCHNFEAVRQWAEKHQVPAYVDEIEFKPPADAIIYNKDFFT